MIRTKNEPSEIFVWRGAVQFSFFNQKCRLSNESKCKIFARIYVTDRTGCRGQLLRDSISDSASLNTLWSGSSKKSYFPTDFQGQNPSLLCLCQRICIMQIFLQDTGDMSNGSQYDNSACITENHYYINSVHWTWPAVMWLSQVLFASLCFYWRYDVIFQIFHILWKELKITGH